MRTSRLFICFILIVLIGASSAAYADMRHQKDGFSISLPSGWIEIPRDAIDNFERELSKAAPDIPTQHYDYGFQLDTARDWFDYPYVLIQVHGNGRIPEKELEKMDEYPIQESIERQKEGFNPIVSNIKAGKMYFDQDSKMIWARMEIDVVGVGRVSCLSGLIPTEKGVIAVHGYSLEEDFSKYRPAFQVIAESVAPDQGLVYKPKWSGSFPESGQVINWMRIIGMTIVGAAIGGLIGLLIARRKRAVGK